MRSLRQDDSNGGNPAGGDDTDTGGGSAHLDARRLARAGRGLDAAAIYRQAGLAEAASGRLVQAVWDLLEASRLDPLSDEGAAEAIAATGSDVDSRVAMHGLGGQQLIARLASAPREALVSHLHPVSYGTDEVIAREELPADRIWLVARGLVRMTRRGARGARVTVAVIGPGELVGESPALGSEQRITTLVAEEPSDLLELRRADLERLARLHPSVPELIDRLLPAVNKGRA